MRRLIGIFAILVLLAACNQGSTTVSPSKINQVEGPQVNVQNDETTAIAQAKAETEAKNDKNTEFVIPINLKKGKIGDFVVVGSMFNQVNKPKGTYFARIAFIEGRDTSSNKIEADADTVKSWIRASQTADFTLEDKGSQFVPLSFRIGSEIKPGVNTPIGTYTFEVQFYKRVSSDFDSKLDGLLKYVYVKVE